MESIVLAWYGWLSVAGRLVRLDRPLRLGAGIVLIVAGLHDTLVYWRLES